MFLQATLSHLSSVSPSLDVSEAAAIGTQRPYTTLDLSTGITRDDWSASLSVENAFDTRAEQNRTSTCTISICGPSSIVIYPLRPRFVSLRVGHKF